MGISISGSTPVVPAVAAGGPTVRTAGRHAEAAAPAEAPTPAAVFSAADFSQAVAVSMYNAAGQSVALTQWLRSGTLPIPASATGNSVDTSL